MNLRCGKEKHHREHSQPLTPTIHDLATNRDPTAQGAGQTQTSKVVPVPNCSLLEEDVREAIMNLEPPEACWQLDPLDE